MNKPTVGSLVLTLSLVVPVWAESTPSATPRPEAPKPAAAPAPAMPTEEDSLSVSDKLRAIVPTVALHRVPARQAFEWYSKVTGIPLVMNWEQLQAEAVGGDTELTLDLTNVPASRLLMILMKQAGGETPLISDVTPWYIEITTKAEANKHPIVRVYDLGDLVHEPMQIGTPPRFDLNSALSNTSSGGGRGSGGASGGRGSAGGSGSTGIFQNDTSQTSSKPSKSLDERSEAIAKVIRDTIEPDIWQENGGEYGSIKVFQGRLVVRAPAYVHAQIGIPSVGGGDEPRSRASRESTERRSSVASPPRVPVGEVSNGVSAVHPILDQTVSAKEGK